MKIKFIFLVVLVNVFLSLQAQDKSLFQKEIFVKGTDTMPYRILLPINYDRTQKYPLILFLHGSGERGTDNESQLMHGSMLFLRDSIREKYPVIVVFPQCRNESYWSNVDRKINDLGKTVYTFQPGGEPTQAMVLLQQLLKSVIKKYPVNKSRIYVGGLSMGGMGTFEIVRRNPKLFAAAFPICGGAVPSTAVKLTKPAWWIFHGAKDDVVPFIHSQKMAEALQQLQADVKFTLYPDVNHNSWDNALAEPTFLSCLFSNSKK